MEWALVVTGDKLRRLNEIYDAPFHRRGHRKVVQQSLAVLLSAAQESNRGIDDSELYGSSIRLLGLIAEVVQIGLTHSATQCFDVKVNEIVPFFVEGAEDIAANNTAFRAAWTVGFPGFREQEFQARLVG